jgi:glycosyltransferase involved in cell wall biosynthesis
MPSSNPDLRVLQIIKGLDIGNVNGGAEQFAINLAQVLQQKGYHVSVCAFFRMGTQTETSWLHKLEKMQIPCFSVSTWSGNNHFQSYLNGIRVLQKTLAKSPHQICHSHFQLGTIAALYLKTIGLTRRVIRTCHVTREWEYSWYGWTREQFISKWLFPLFVDSEVGVSQAILERLRENPGVRFSKHKPRCIYNGIPNDIFITSPTDKDESIPDNPKIIGVVGRLSQEKGQQTFIEAAQKVHQIMPDVMFWIIGDGDLREELEALTRRLRLSECIHFWGQRKDAVDLISKMDLLVIPSIREGLPTVVLEGYAKGVPVLGTNVDGINELVEPGKTGWLVPAMNPIAMAESIIDALNDKEKLVSFSQKGREYARQFTIENAAEQYLKLYSELLN